MTNQWQEQDTFTDALKQGFDTAVKQAVNKQFAPRSIEMNFMKGASVLASFFAFRTAAKASSGSAKVWYWYAAILQLVASVAAPKIFQKLEDEKERRLSQIDPAQRILLETGETTNVGVER